VQAHNNVPFYQNLLLSKANANPTYYLASNLNYSVTKKRLIMMTKNTSATRALIKKGLVIPILTAIVFSFCTKTVAQEKTTTKEVPTKNKSKLFENYYEKTTFEVKDENGKVIATKKYAELTPKEKNIVPPVILQKNEPFTTESFEKAIQKGGPKTFVVDLFDKKNIKVKSDDENAIYNSAGLTEKPEYQGGIELFYQFVAKNYQAPRQEGLKGKVYATFIVEKDGSLTDIKVLRDIGYGTGDEAIRVLKLCPNWTPGKINDEPVRVLYSLPITIQTAG
jgi:Na+-translocating ferredoxin:NAD+ oxidoreductase RnfG subunit